ncbi:hypothetical protein GCM10010383_43980 [Streptomyces lomondensis]|uniref:Uncharacterized protein n=1 Tax=Streptomyces lomondensis TaxID=68229 RepID=A0ABQ2XBE8_9ACTN|nr:hypothetical protein GCM10010383_43980 [Streptomyces lomondensis]
MQAVVARVPREGAVRSGSSPPRSGCAMAMANSLPEQVIPRWGPLNCDDPYSCCLLPAYGANSPGITESGSGRCVNC